MNYKFETIMTWIMYVRNGIWEIDNHGKYKPDASTIRDKFEALFLNELIREYNDCKHTMVGLHSQIGSVTVFINPEKLEFKVGDNYNNLLAFYHGIYESCSGKKLCLNIIKHGMDKSYIPEAGYFQYREHEDEEYVYVESVVNGTCKSNAPNVRRLISILFARHFEYLESTNPETFMFMDYSKDEKEEMIKDCEQYDKRINKKKALKKAGPEEE